MKMCLVMQCISSLSYSVHSILDLFFPCKLCYKSKTAGSFLCLKNTQIWDRKVIFLNSVITNVFADRCAQHVHNSKFYCLKFKGVK